MAFCTLGATEDVIEPEVLLIRSIDEENRVDPSAPGGANLYAQDVWERVKVATGATKITDPVLNKYRRVETDVAQRPRPGRSTAGLPGWVLPVVGLGAVFLFFRARKG